MSADLRVCCRRLVIRVWVLNGYARVLLNGSHHKIRVLTWGLEWRDQFQGSGNLGNHVVTPFSSVVKIRLFVNHYRRYYT